ncbi:MAG: pyruvate dehydrogenase (acetyl-transferring) E1 component subunit alpha [Deltaproteobacteria bacterium]|nr:pyruvate dehydrogenase (acetyl-transferring) E1 component subunit alpha [Deltaproteobacteria bacterium]MBI3076816.1 pyruvate dehydrogenase (acetyl-transferring) E1 component subunit alpha [Deltaproteobacteria bacterium]
MDARVMRHLLRQMLLIRRFEEKAAEMYALGKIGGFLHLYIGQEAVAAGAMSAIREDDYAISHYREHGHCLAKGTDPQRIMAELFGRHGGLSKGKGGSMHLFDRAHNFLGGHAIVGGHIPIATGVGFAIKYEGKDQVVLCFFGDGAVNQGVLHESFNLAMLWKLPVIYICENNWYAMGTPLEKASAVQDLYKKAAAYEMPGEPVDGMDVLAVRECVGRAVARARGESLPTFIEARTYRYRGHSMRDPSAAIYRTREEVEEQKKRDPIVRFQQCLMEQGALDEDEWRKMDKEVTDVVDEAVAYADASPEPPLGVLYEDV